MTQKPDPAEPIPDLDDFRRRSEKLEADIEKLESERPKHQPAPDHEDEGGLI